MILYLYILYTRFSSKFPMSLKLPPQNPRASPQDLALYASQVSLPRLSDVRSSFLVGYPVILPNIQ